MVLKERLKGGKSMRVLDPRDFGRATGSSTRVNNRIQDGDPLVGNNIILTNGHKTVTPLRMKNDSVPLKLDEVVFPLNFPPLNAQNNTF
jgi:hypothetical protein